MSDVFESSPVLDEEALVGILDRPIKDEKPVELSKEAGQSEESSALYTHINNPANDVSLIGLTIMVLGFILTGAPTSGRVSQLVGLVQCLLGAIIFSQSL